jgi:hypothetical protein
MSPPLHAFPRLDEMDIRDLVVIAHKHYPAVLEEMIAEFAQLDQR